jgi:rhodanese-related sulfurtransferase
MYLGGFLLAAVIFHVIPDAHEKRKATVNRLIGFYYLGAAFVLLLSCRMNMPWSLILAWPAAAMGTVSVAYFGAGARVLRKHRGRLPMMTQWLLAPWLLGQEISWWWYRRQGAKCDQLTPRVWMGSVPDHDAAYEMVHDGVTDVLDMTAEFEAPRAFRELPGYKNIPVMDLTAPTQAQLHDAAAFIEKARKEGVVFVHCKSGHSRTAAALGAWLLQSGGTTEAALAQMREARPGMIIRPEVVKALREMEASLMAPGRKPG